MANRVLIALILVSTAAFAVNVALSAIAGATEGGERSLLRSYLTLNL